VKKMAQLIEHEFALLFAILCTGVTLWMAWRGKEGKVSYIRELPQIKAFEIAVSRATEMGKPVFLAPGCKLITHSRAGAATMAAFNVLRYVSKLCAQQQTRMVVGLVGGVNIPYAVEAIKLASIEAGAPEQEQNQEIRYLAESENLLPYAAMLQREEAGCNILFGDSGATTLVVLSSGIQEGVMQIAGNAQVMNACWLPPLCDYFFIGEEIPAVSAYLSGSTEERQTILGHDIIKIACLLLLIVGIVAKFALNFDVSSLAG
jgi:hypothetical protein